MSPTEATVYICLFWGLFMLQFFNIQPRKYILCPLVFAAAGLTWWFVWEIPRFRPSSIVDGTLYVTLAQFIFIFPRRVFLLVVDLLRGTGPRPEDEDSMFFVRMCYYAILWLFYALLGDNVLFVSINVANVSVQSAYVLLRQFAGKAKRVEAKSKVQAGMAAVEPGAKPRALW